jgi:hypothetical protein
MKKNNLPPDPHKMNNDRAEWAGASLRHYRSQTGHAYENVLASLLCDLLHWCDRNGIAFDAELSRGRTRYDKETGQEGTPDLYREALHACRMLVNGYNVKRHKVDWEYIDEAHSTAKDVLSYV